MRLRLATQTANTAPRRDERHYDADEISDYRQHA